MRPIISPRLPSPPEHCEHAWQAGEMLYFSGQLGVGPNEDPNRPIEDQVTKALTVLETILGDLGLDRTAIAKITIFLTDPSLWSRLDLSYAKFFGNHKPARTVVSCPSLPYGSKIEIDGVAYVSPTTRGSNQSY